MALLSLAVPAVKAYAYFASKMPSLGQEKPSDNSQFLNLVFWLLITAGTLFGLSSLYDYYNAVYIPIVAKAYMSITLLGLAMGGWLLFLIVKGIKSAFHKKPTIGNELATAEQYAKNALHILEAEGGELIKHHPLATVLGGLCLGVLSGTLLNTKAR